MFGVNVFIVLNYANYTDPRDLSACFTHLFVHVYVDQGVVNSADLGHVYWYHLHQHGQLNIRVEDDRKSQSGIRQPAHEERQHHHHYHPRHLRLCPCSHTSTYLSYLSMKIFLQTIRGGLSTQIKYFNKTTATLIKYYYSKVLIFKFNLVEVKKST